MKSLPNPLMPSGGMGNYQIQYTRDRHALPLTRGHMGEVEVGLATGQVAKKKAFS